MKAAGVCCILLGAAWGVLLTLRERARRRILLADLERSLTRMAEEIRLSRTPLPELLGNLAALCGEDAAAFFRTVSEGAEQGRSPSRLWRAAAETLPLSGADRQTLSALSTVLRGDEEQLRKSALAVAERMMESGGEMDRRKPAEVRQSAALILSAAVLLVILLY